MTFFLIILGLVLILAGLVGIVAPGLPDAILIFLGMLAFGGAFGFERLSLLTWIILGLLALLMFGAEIFASVLGAKIAKASPLATGLAIVGALLGFLAGSLPGLLIGPFLGAVVGELLSGRDAIHSVRSGFATLLGFLAGRFMKAVIAIVMLLTFTIGMLA